jgi:hypothetical protein
MFKNDGGQINLALREIDKTSGTDRRAFGTNRAHRIGTLLLSC